MTISMNKLKLKPCPFCGCNAIARLYEGDCAEIICTTKTCFCRQSLGLGQFATYDTIIETFDKLAEKWNTRPAELSE